MSSGVAMTLHLALAEIGRLRRHPAVLATVGATAALLVWQEHRQSTMPNVAVDTLIAATALLVVGVTLMVVANLATLRDQRGGMPETLAAMPGRSAVRTGAVAMATTCGGVVVAASFLGLYLLLRVTTGPVVAGAVDPAEMLAVPMGVAALAGLGVLLARWLPTPIAAPVSVVVLLVFIVERSFEPWFLPLTETFSGKSLAAPAPLRLGYLWAVVVLAGTLALLRHARMALRIGGGVVALAVLVPLALALSRSAESAAAVEVGRDCTERGGVTYCHLPGFAAWVPLWAEAVEPVFDALPSNLRGRFPTIRQYRSVPRYGESIPVDAYVDEFWGRGELRVESETSLAGRIAAALTGFQAPGTAGATCDGGGQARTVVALWLAGNTAAIPSSDARDVWGATHLGQVTYGEVERRAAQALLDDRDARALIARHWTTLTDPATTIERAAPLLALPTSPVTADRPDGAPCR